MTFENSELLPESIHVPMKVLNAGCFTVTNCAACTLMMILCMPRIGYQLCGHDVDFRNSY